MKEVKSGFERHMQEAKHIVEHLKMQPGKCHTLTKRNESGILWEKLWVCRGDQHFESKVCAGGCFVDWQPSTEAQAILEIADDLRVIKGG